MSLRTVKALLAATVACFILATAYFSVLIVERQKALQAVSRNDVTWSVAQTLVEFTRFEQRIAAFGDAGSPVDADEVQLRFDILVSRAKTLETGGIATFMMAEAKALRAVEKLKAALAEAEPIVDRLDTPGASLRLSQIFSPLDGDIAALASAAKLAGERHIVDDQQDLLRLHLMFSSLTGGLIICGIALIVLLVWHNRLLHTTQHRLGDLAEDLKRTSDSLAVQNHSLDAALTNMTHGLCMCDAEGRLVVSNQRFREFFGLPADALAPGELFAPAVAPGGTDPFAEFRQFQLEQRELIRDGRSGSFVRDRPDGRALSVSHSALADGGWIAIYEDVTERRQAELQIAHMAHYDSLTDLANRVLFGDRLVQAMAQPPQDVANVSVLCLDLDRFKDVNDSLGHHAGDELLKAVADRLRAVAGPQDLVARLGGDEFAILVDGGAVTRDCGELARRLIEAVSRPYAIDGQELAIGLSIGIAPAAGAKGSASRLLKQADLALYVAKADGKGIYRFFNPQMDEQLQTRRALESDLRHALANGEMDVYYQPLVDADRCKINGFEALMRWHHPRRGMVSPAEFIPVAEDTGLIVVLGEWMLREACARAATWPEDLSVAVNISAVQLRSGSLVSTVVQALTRTGLAPSRLEIEITESVLMEDNEGTLNALHQLRALGVRIAMDDFGTGHSSLSYLRNLPFDKIKIDKSFVRDLDTRPDSLAIIRLITGLANSLSMTTTAEGVETEEQYLQLRAAGCTEVQGYYFARPKPGDELATVLPGRTPQSVTAVAV